MVLRGGEEKEKLEWREMEVEWCSSDGSWLGRGTVDLCGEVVWVFFSFFFFCCFKRARERAEKGGGVPSQRRLRGKVAQPSLTEESVRRCPKLATGRGFLSVGPGVGGTRSRPCRRDGPALLWK